LVYLKQNYDSAFLEDKGLDSSFITCIYLGFGGFNLIFSVLPNRILNLFELIGFSGNRSFGIQCLKYGKLKNKKVPIGSRVKNKNQYQNQRLRLIFSTKT
jgi:hypothetical protein